LTYDFINKLTITFDAQIFYIIYQSRKYAQTWEVASKLNESTSYNNIFPFATHIPSPGASTTYEEGR